MKKVYILKGLPASGKTTWAKTQIQANPGSFTRVNKDDLRDMLHNGRWSKHNEKQVLRIRDEIIMQSLEAGRHVIVDDTNLHPKHEQHIHEMVKKLAEVRVKFFDIDVESAVERDLKRTRSVGRDVIESMYESFLRPEKPTYEGDPTKPEAIICDIDGTLAHMKDRSPYDWSKVGQDAVDYNIRELLRNYHSLGVRIVLVSGRDGSCRRETLAWLEDKEVPYDELHMRPAGNNEKDTVIKKRIFDDSIRDNYNVLFVLDDRDQVVDMWRNDIGLQVFQVAEGKF